MTGHSGSSSRLGAFLVAVVAAIFLFADRDVLAVADDFDRMAARYLVDARKQTLATCRERGLELPPDFLAWIDRDPARQASVYGCLRYCSISSSFIFCSIKRFSLFLLLSSSKTWNAE